MTSGLYPKRNSFFLSTRHSRFLLLFHGVVIVFILLVSAFPSRVESSPIRYPIVGIHSGYNYVGGYFEENLTDGAALGIFCVPWMGSFLMIDTDLTWSYINVESSPDSFLMSLALTVGPLFHYSPMQRLDLFGGIIIRGSYLYFYGDNSGATAQAFKVGFGVATGFFLNIYKGIDLRFTYRFTENDLSSRTFMSHELLAGISYAFSVKASSVNDPQLFYGKVKARHARARELYMEGRFADALRVFKEVRELDREHREALEYINLIAASLDFYEKAAKLKGKGDLFGAITMLKQTDARMEKAQRELASLRKKLQGRVKKLEAGMIRLYNSKKYVASIRQGEKILLVDPKNRNAALYLQRARRRYNALRKFQ